MTDTTHTDEHDTGAAPGSVLDLITTIREDTAAEGEPLFVPLTAYNERIALRFDYPVGGFAAIRKALGGQQRPGARRPKPDDEAELTATMNIMVTCCTGVVEVKPGLPEEDWPSIDPDGRDVLINRELARLLNIEVPADLKRGVGRHVLRHLYSPRAHATGMFRGDPALLGDGVAVQSWLDAGGVRADEELAGK